MCNSSIHNFWTNTSHIFWLNCSRTREKIIHTHTHTHTPDKHTRTSTHTLTNIVTQTQTYLWRHNCSSVPMWNWFMIFASGAKAKAKAKYKKSRTNVFHHLFPSLWPLHFCFSTWIFWTVFNYLIVRYVLICKLSQSLSPSHLMQSCKMICPSIKYNQPRKDNTFQLEFSEPCLIILL